MLVEELHMKIAECLHEAKQAFILDELHPKAESQFPLIPQCPDFAPSGFGGPVGAVAMEAMVA